jgi:hypothetical protein
MRNIMYAALAVVGVIAQQDSHSHSCLFKTPQGSTYDLTAFETHPPFTLISPNGAFEYSLSVCKSVGNVPSACGGPGSEPQYAAAIQTDRRFGRCFVIGDVRRVSVQQSHEVHHDRGVDVVYSGGTRCANGQERELRLHFVCAPGFEVSAPPRFVLESTGHEDMCHYNVTWPSKHACPVSTHSFLSWWPQQHATHAVQASAADSGILDTLWRWFWLSSFWWYGGLFLYFILGCTYNAWQGYAEVGWAATPHRAHWERQLATIRGYIPLSVQGIVELPGIRHALAFGINVGKVLAVAWQTVIILVRGLTRNLIFWMRRPPPKKSDTKQPMQFDPHDDDAMAWAEEDELPRTSKPLNEPISRRAPARAPPAHPTPSKEEIARAIDAVASTIEAEPLDVVISPAGVVRTGDSESKPNKPSGL